MIRNTTCQDRIVPKMGSVYSGVASERSRIAADQVGEADRDHETDVHGGHGLRQFWRRKQIREQRKSRRAIARAADAADEAHDEQRAGRRDQRAADVAAAEDEQSDPDDERATVFVRQRTDHQAGEGQRELASQAENERHLLIGELHVVLDRLEHERDQEADCRTA